MRIHLGSYLSHERLDFEDRLEEFQPSHGRHAPDTIVRGLSGAKSFKGGVVVGMNYVGALYADGFDKSRRQSVGHLL